LVFGSIAARTVAARSAAEIDVLLGLDTDAKRGIERRRVLIDHQRNLELVEAFRGHRHADQAAAVTRHEVDGLGRDLLRRNRQIAFVLPILVVDDNHHATGADDVDGLLDRRKRAAAPCTFGDTDFRALAGHVSSCSTARATYLPIMSHSRLT
jgi:hypothetical protein